MSKVKLIVKDGLHGMTSDFPEICICGHQKLSHPNEKCEICLCPSFRILDKYSFPKTYPLKEE